MFYVKPISMLKGSPYIYLASYGTDKKVFFYCWDCLFRYYFAGIIIEIALARSILKICSKTDNRKVKKTFLCYFFFTMNLWLSVCLENKTHNTWPNIVLAFIGNHNRKIRNRVKRRFGQYICSRGSTESAVL